MAKKTEKASKKTVVHSKNFRKSKEVEAFYRFVYDNDMRREAKMILERICSLSKKNFKSKLS
jgi:hypothetical protein